MPTVLRTGGFAFGIYTGDHEPPHVHARYAGTRCRIEIETLRVKKGSMNVADRAKALRIVAEHREQLLQAWDNLRRPKG